MSYDLEGRLIVPPGATMNATNMPPPVSVTLCWGPFGGRRVTLSATTPRIRIGTSTYCRIDDPDTGEFLGGYTYDEAAQ